MKPTLSKTGQKGFSLVELLLTLVLILCLAAASVFCYTAIHKQSGLDEGADRLQTVIRFARAEAATRGRKVRITFEAVPVGSSSSTASNVSGDSSSGSGSAPSSESAPSTTFASSTTELRKIKLEWEPDFLTAPGVFQQCTNKTWSESLVNELVGVEKVVPLDASGAIARNAESSESTPAQISSEENADKPEAKEDSAAANDFPSITFYPDGSSDSAEIVLASVNDEDTRRIAIRLSGILGSVSKHPVVKKGDSDLLDEYEDETSTPVTDSSTEPFSTAAAGN